MRFEGNFEGGSVYVEGDQLRFRPENRQPFLLTPLTSTVFVAEAQDMVRLEFVFGADGKIEKLVYRNDDGKIVELTPLLVCPLLVCFVGLRSGFTNCWFAVGLY